MLAVARHAQHARRDDHGVPWRASLEASAARGNTVAIAALEIPEYPDALEYLREWTSELAGTSGEGMNGAAPLMWTTIDAWARRTGNEPSPEECRALLHLDAVMRRPEIVDEPQQADSDGVPVPADIPAWPKQEGA